jgi:NAD(P)H-dependent flavin oxidoreductase YrpB (nitropropane dioxygenase family)
MLKAGLVDGDPSAGVLASGQVVGVIDDLPTCEELIDRVVTEAAAALRRSEGYLTGR